MTLVAEDLEQLCPEIEVSLPCFTPKVANHSILCFAIETTKDRFKIHFVRDLLDRSTMNEVKTTKQFFQRFIIFLAREGLKWGDHVLLDVHHDSFVAKGNRA